MALLKLQRDSRIDLKIILSTHTPFVNNLNKIVKQFLREDHDYWITFDDDNPPTQNVIDLVFLDLDIIGCPTPVWANMKKGDYPIYWNALDVRDDGWTPHLITKGLQEVDVVGSGCMVIARRVVEQMKKPLFFRDWNEDGIVERGHDYLFCQKAKAQGFRVYAHYDYPCLHFNEVELTEISTAFGAVYG